MTAPPAVVVNGEWSGFRHMSADPAMVDSANADLIDILETLDVPIVVVLNNFTIACFNRAAAEVFSISPSDIGRSPRAVSGLAESSHLEEWCAQAMAGWIPSRYDFHANGKSFVLRIAPYAKAGRRITGAVLTFANVTAFRASIDQAIYEPEYTKAILNSVPHPLIAVGTDLRVQTANRAFFEMFRIPREALQGTAVCELGNGAFANAGLLARLREILAAGSKLPPLEIDHTFPGIGHRTVMLEADAGCLPSRSGKMILLALQDITERKRTEAALARHRDEQAALYQFTDRLFRADSLDKVYDGALETIMRVLRCERASLLLFDDSSVMRFVAWRGLSDGYRRAVEGHSPWTRETRDPQPICIDDIDSAEITESLRESIKAEGIGALAFVPVMERGRLVGRFMTYYRAPNAFGDAEVQLAVTIARQLGFSLERRRAEERLRETQAKLEAELTATQRLQQISTQLIHENNVDALYDHILDAAVAIMGSDMASMQLVDESQNALRMLAWRGFDPLFGKVFELNRPDTKTSCSVARRLGQRVVVSDVEACDFIAGTPALDDHRKTGIRAVQSTPLLSRAGDMLGMISTHWRRPHEPSERDLRLLDVLARQAADLIERKQAEQASRRLATIVESSQDAIVSKDLNGLIATWNPGAERLFGYVADEVIGRPITILIPRDRLQEEDEILAHLRRGERVEPYETVRQRKDGSRVDISLAVSPIRDAAGRVVGASKIARDISDKKRAEVRQELLTREIHHRTKNLFAVVLAVVSRSFAGKDNVEDAQAAVLSRLHSLGQTHFMLIDKEWQGADLTEIVRAETSPYAGRVHIEGPHLMLTPKAAQNFALALHELATNAAKYGALSNATGQVHIGWSRIRSDSSNRLVFRWREQGGPPVQQPTRKGFGTTVLEQVMAEHFEVQPRIDFLIDGVSYELAGSLDALSADEHASSAGESQ